MLSWLNVLYIGFTKKWNWVSYGATYWLMDTVSTWGASESKWPESTPTEIHAGVSVPAGTRAAGSSVPLEFCPLLTVNISSSLLSLLTGSPLLNHHRLQWDVTTPRCCWRINGPSPPSRPDAHDILHQLLLHLSWKGILISPGHKNFAEVKLFGISDLTCECYLRKLNRGAILPFAIFINHEGSRGLSTNQFSLKGRIFH